MIHKFLRGGLKQRLLAPTFAVVLVSMLSLSVALILIQQKQLGKLGGTVAAELKKSNASAQAGYTALGEEVHTHLVELSGNVVHALTQETQAAMDAERTVQGDAIEAMLRNSADSIGDLLAQVAPPTILANNFLELINYTKAANRNPDVVYALYLKPDGSPLTRYIDRKDPDIQRFLETGAGKRKLDKIINASKTDPAVLIVEKPIQLEGKTLGTVLICVSKRAAQERIAAMSERFTTMVDANSRRISEVIKAETGALESMMAVNFDRAADQNNQAVRAVSDTIASFAAAINARTKWLTAGLGGAAALVVLVVLFLIVAKTSRILQQVAGRLHDGAGSVAAATDQITVSSQRLAEGASEQAASIEETSASLEEMAAMTGQNARNAGEADQLMQDAKHIVEHSNEAMQALTGSMAEISKSSEDTQKIVKTIDEIAFQTNLLALNAAVEAARAGEAGAGFAVVADEVRNLALRAAEAAKDTAQLIDGTAGRIKDGSALVEKTNGAFTEIATATAKVSDLLSEIATASREQAQGVEQINKAVTEMDKVVQTNAATAEESSSASEEMRSQAGQMQALVDDLVHLVEGARKTGATAAPPAREDGRVASAWEDSRADGKSSAEQALSLEETPTNGAL